jgi:hypothetical protein
MCSNETNLIFIRYHGTCVECNYQIPSNILGKKYNIDFDTLVLDCEGAFYYILNDFPEILENIKTIFVENDYNDIEHKNFVDLKLKEANKITHYQK